MSTLNAVYRGQSIEATATFKDKNGVLTDPTTVTFQVRSPGGVVTSYVSGTDNEVSHDSVGVFTLKLVPNQAGSWPILLTGTGTVEASAYGVVQVNPDPFA